MPILIIIALNLILYVRTMKFLLVADDLAWYLRYSKYGWMKLNEVHSLEQFKRFIFERLYGGFTFGKNVSLDHLFSVALHTTIAIMMYYVFGAVSDYNVSFWAAILYSCNPINNQTSIWLNGRRYAINIILVLGMMLLAPLTHGWAYAGALYWITTNFHMTAFFAPILLLGKYPWILLGVPVLLAARWKNIVWKINHRYERIKDDDRLKLTPERLFIIIKYYGHYFFKMLFPGICAMTYSKLFFWGQTKEGNKNAYSFNFDLLLGIISIIISGALIYFLPVGYKYMAAYMFLSLIQWCAIIPVVQDLADRYAGMATVFMMFFVSYFINLYGGQYAVAILSGIIGYYIPLLLTVMRMFQSEGSRWEYQRYFFPSLPAPLKFECEWLIHDQTDPMKAWVLIQNYLKFGGRDFSILHQAAKCHQMVGRFDEALKFAEEASKNYSIGNEAHQKIIIDNFIKGCVPPSGSIVGTPSRQVMRAEERKSKKK